ncbi:hypothetical protein imdm_2346 [gamma proteobacterium IMCC2047]|nr:hypothetical protein imdm_2346 [gamma proteobacterium IMCC2047]
MAFPVSGQNNFLSSLCCDAIFRGLVWVKPAFFLLSKEHC